MWLSKLTEYQSNPCWQYYRKQENIIKLGTFWLLNLVKTICLFLISEKQVLFSSPHDCVSLSYLSSSRWRSKSNNFGWHRRWNILPETVFTVNIRKWSALFSRGMQTLFRFQKKHKGVSVTVPLHSIKNFYLIPHEQASTQNLLIFVKNLPVQMWFPEQANN